MSIELRLAFERCPRTCSVCDGTHHWYPEEEGVECKHCDAGIPWETKCNRCGHGFISHFEEGGDLSCAEVTPWGEGESDDCDCPLFVHDTGKVATP